jgi:serine/threonine protein kinase/tetratricopeptide (TPR) repeat protein
MVSAEPNPEAGVTDLNALEALYFAALEKPVAERPVFLDAACGGNADLRARVERLLTAQANVGDFLGAPDRRDPEGTVTLGPEMPGPAPDCSGRDEHADTVIAGRYTLVEMIGEGGMGSVWRAQQTDPVQRAVAVKLIKAGMDSKQVLARFEAERQALALMNHPNIATVLDGGLHDGRPFFVMELVKGVPITEHCDHHKLTPKQRLELFVPVCQAIQHAHQKGIIHRDIKPSNVLVARYDDRPVPKVIDFGVAKAVDEPLTDKTLATGFGVTVGTPEYMSPEQASFNNRDVDTRSDVYALGVLLYELLAGSPPFSRKELERVGVLEILRVIREQEPPRPSAKLSTADALPTLSANRGTEPAKLTRLVRGELDWIVMKALEKDRARRYETPSALARDVERHLRNEAVEARGPSTWYRLGKFLRRNRWTVLAVALVLASVVGWANSFDMTRQANLISTAEAAARTEAFEYRYFLKYDLLGGPDRHNPNRTMQESLDRAAQSLGTDRMLDPRTEARLRELLGEAYLAMGSADRAEAQLTRAVQLFKTRYGTEPWNEEDLGVMSTLALLYTLLERHDRAVPLREELLAQYRREQPIPDFKVHNYVCAIIAMGACYADQGRFPEAEALLSEALDLCRGPRSPHVHGPDGVRKWALQHRARCLIARNEYTAAEGEVRECQSLAPRDDPERPNLDCLLGEALRGQRRYTDAEPLFLSAYKGLVQRSGTWPRDEAAVKRVVAQLVALYTAWDRPDDVRKWRAAPGRRPDRAPAPREVMR